MRNLLNRPLAKVLSFLDIKCVAYEDWKSQYYIDLYFGLVMESIQKPTVVNLSPFLDYKDQDGFLYKLNQLCVLARSTFLLLIKEAHYSSHGGHFGVQKIMLHMHKTFIVLL